MNIPWKKSHEHFNPLMVVHNAASFLNTNELSGQFSPPFCRINMGSSKQARSYKNTGVADVFLRC